MDTINGITFVNCTDHPVQILSEQLETLLDLPAGKAARLKMVEVAGEPIAGIPTQRSEFGEALNLPDPQDGVMLIVSNIVRAGLPHRTDLVSPGKVVDGDLSRRIGFNVN